MSTEQRTPLRNALGDRYLLGEPIGRGGMGWVYRATDVALERPVALKLLAPELARDPVAVRRFEREALAAASLSHPNVVSIFDTGSDGDRHWIVMEEVRGRTLAAIVAAEGPLPADRVVRIVRDVASALAAAHAAGIVHRDVTPGNVMLTDDGRVKVMDFGIARAGSTTVTAVTRTGSIMGTAAYLSPEQARGEPATAASDLYALGAVAFELLTGRPPFVADAPVAVAYQHVRQDPVAPSALRSSVPPALDAVVLDLLAKEPTDRPASAELLVARLEALHLPTAPGDESTAPPAAITRPIAPIRTAAIPLATEAPNEAPTRTVRARPSRTPADAWTKIVAAVLAVVAAIVIVAAILASVQGSGGAPRPTTKPSSPAAVVTTRPVPPSPKAKPPGHGSGHGHHGHGGGGDGE
jgi:serine/threonine protein kinase